MPLDIYSYKINPISSNYGNSVSRDSGSIVDALSTSNLYYELYDSNNKYIGKYKSNHYAYTSGSEEINVDTYSDLYDNGYIVGDFKLIYTLEKEIFTPGEYPIFIHEISPSRTEVRVIPSILNDNIARKFFDFFNNYAKTYNGTIKKILSVTFEDNSKNEVINWTYDKVTFPNFPNAGIIKLSTPLPPNIIEGSYIYLTLPLSDSYTFNIKLNEPLLNQEIVVLNKPNFDIDINKISKQSTPYQNWTNLTSTNTNTSNTLVNNYFGSALSGIPLNTDFREFENFVFYSSAETRLNNFFYKLRQIEDIDTAINNLYTVSGSVFQINTLETQKSTILGGFDAYEKYLYYESASYVTSSYGEYWPTTWPKDTNVKPYTLFNTTSSIAQDWFNGAISSASLYDRLNRNSLRYTIPAHIQLDPGNNDYITFVNMVGHHFDILWLYTHELELLSNREESLYEGMAKDLIYHVLENQGWTPESNAQFDDLWYYALGTDVSGSTTYATESYSVSQSLITVTTESIPTENISKTIWKRILNNLPYLYKNKGTVEGIRGLLNCYGVPSTILRIKEYGGPEPVDHISTYTYDKFRYELTLDTGSIVELYRAPLQNGVIQSTELRFKTVTDVSDPKLYTQQLYGNIGVLSGSGIGIFLEYVSQSYGNVNVLFGNGVTGSIVMSIPAPIFDGDWWTILFTHNENNEVTGSHSFNTYLGCNRYDKITHFYTASYTASITTGSHVFASGTYYIGANGYNNMYFSGSVQEFRYWSTALDTGSLRNHILSPVAYNGNTVSTSYDSLGCRFSFGLDLNTSSLYSIHPNQTQLTYLDGTPITASIISSSYIAGEERYTIQWPDLSVHRQISNKVRYENNSITSGSNLSRDTRVETSAYDKYPIDSNKLGIYLSVTNEVNEDIAEQMGGFRIDDYIGDPASIDYNYYPLLRGLKNEYLKKTSGSYDVRAYHRLTNYFDSSLFRQVNKLIPCRVSPILGLGVESSLLDRSKVAVATSEMGYEDLTRYAYIVATMSLQMSGSYNTYSSSISFPDIISINAISYVLTPSQSWDSFYDFVLSNTQQNVTRTYSVIPLSSITTSINTSSILVAEPWTYPTVSFIYNNSLYKVQPYWLSELYQPIILDYATRDINTSWVEEKYYIGSAQWNYYSSSQKYLTDYAYLPNEYVVYNSASYQTRNTAEENRKYSGCKISSSWYNIPSDQTPDGQPVIEIFLNSEGRLISQNVNYEGRLRVE